MQALALSLHLCVSCCLAPPGPSLVPDLTLAVDGAPSEGVPSKLVDTPEKVVPIGSAILGSLLGNAVAFGATLVAASVTADGASVDVTFLAAAALAPPILAFEGARLSSGGHGRIAGRAALLAVLTQVGVMVVALTATERAQTAAAIYGVGTLMLMPLVVSLSWEPRPTWQPPRRSAIPEPVDP